MATSREAVLLTYFAFFETRLSQELRLSFLAAILQKMSFGSSRVLDIGRVIQDPTTRYGGQQNHQEW